MADHQIILQALEVLRQVSARVEAGDLVDRDEAICLVRFLREFAHEYHDGKERSILLPAIFDAAVSPRDDMKTIIQDHDRLCRYIFALEDALRFGNDSEFVTLAERYINTLSSHIFNEEHFIFDEVTRDFTDERDAAVLLELDSYGSSLRNKCRETFEQSVRDLERKYAFSSAV
jgi:hemerythrin-like domain-containing protein